ncbi:MAG: nucleotide exchange factor GrpE, partial [Clostridiales bacterium]|nr:nucleotide exchange factor GrpE [Clostridiales bacterium]
MSDEELFFGADEEPVKDEVDNGYTEDAAASDKASAEGPKAEDKKPEKPAAAADDEEEEEELPADSSEATNELEARYMSLYAEYDNYRKRTQKEKDNLYADAIATVTKEF